MNIQSQLFTMAAHPGTPLCHTLAGMVDSRNWDVSTNAQFSPSGDKIFILQIGTVTTLHTVVLVWFTNVLAEYIHTIMIA